MPLKNWSPIPASNNQAPPFGWPEGQLPSTVNDCARQDKADVRTQFESTEWFDWGDTISQNATNIFKVTGDATTRYLKNRRIKLFDSATLYGTIKSATYSAPDTTVTIESDGGNLSLSLSSVALSILTPTSIAIPSTLGRKGTDIASATSIDLAAGTGDFNDVTGTTTITALGTLAAGIEKTLRFTGILILTHNATSLILPGAASITTVAGDVARFRSLGGGNWLCTNYQRADGTPLASQINTPLTVIGNSSSGASIRLPEDTDNGTNYIGLKAPDSITNNLVFTLPGVDGTANQALVTDAAGTLSFQTFSKNMILVQDISVSNVASVTFTNLTAFANYILIYEGLYPGTNAVSLQLRMSTNNGTSYDTGANYNYAFGTHTNAGSGQEGAVNSTFIGLGGAIGNNSGFPVGGILQLLNLTSGVFHHVFNENFYTDNSGGSVRVNKGGGEYKSTTSYNGIELKFSSGIIVAGKLKLIGY